MCLFACLGVCTCICVCGVCMSACASKVIIDTLHSYQILVWTGSQEFKTKSLMLLLINFTQTCYSVISRRQKNFLNSDLFCNQFCSLIHSSSYLSFSVKRKTGLIVLKISFNLNLAIYW